MLSYKHIFHAGNFADVHKHLILIALLKHLQKSKKPCTYIDTHSGSGIYDLRSAQANKTGEYVEGIEKFKKLQDPAIMEYVELIHRLNGSKSTRYYPGSPEIAALLSRPDDHLHFIELHNNEFQLLRDNYGKLRNTFLHHKNGFECLVQLCPPTIRRGLVLIDPPYEIKSDYSDVARTIIKAHKKWPQAIFAIWYPMLKANRHEEMKSLLTNANLPGLLISEYIICHPDEVRGMYGTGMMMVNMPKSATEAILHIEKVINQKNHFAPTP